MQKVVKRMYTSDVFLILLSQAFRPLSIEFVVNSGMTEVDLHSNV